MVKISSSGVATVTTSLGFIDFDFNSHLVNIKIVKNTSGNNMSISVKREDLMKVVTLMLKYDRMKMQPQGQ